VGLVHGEFLITAARGRKVKKLEIPLHTNIFQDMEVWLFN
jgi:hypothetical protein